jgi:hypothetical protein
MLVEDFRQQCRDAKEKQYEMFGLVRLGALECQMCKLCRVSDQHMGGE